jgi:hypothetical protein
VSQAGAGLALAVLVAALAVTCWVALQTSGIARLVFLLLAALVAFAAARAWRRPAS